MKGPGPVALSCAHKLEFHSIFGKLEPLLLFECQSCKLFIHTQLDPNNHTHTLNAKIKAAAEYLNLFYV